MTARLIDTEGPRYLDRYELIAELASGGMATVYLARLGGLAGFQRLVAIKHLHPHLEHDQQFVQMFLDEARLAAGIHHPYVVPILEVGASTSGHYLVMEYIEGDTLARLLARAMSAEDGQFPMSVALRVMVHTLEGLHAAHELTDDFGRALELVHRDVSPQNILVGVDGVSRITDFGVARALSRLTSTQAGQFKGKLAYMAPEQAEGASMDRRTDVFAAGIVTWEALCLRRLFRGETDAETLNRVLFEPIPKTRDFNPSVPVPIDLVIQRALCRDPEGRFATCLEFAEALEAAAMGEGMLASVRDVAAFVQRIMGQEITAQRDKVRAWLARSEPSQAWPAIPAEGRASLLGAAPGPPTSLSVGSMSLGATASLPRGSLSVVGSTSAAATRRSGHRGLVAGAAVLGMALVVAAVGISAWRLRATAESAPGSTTEPVQHAHDAPSVSAQPPAPASTLVAAPSASASEPAASGGAPGAAEPAASARNETRTGNGSRSGGGKANPGGGAVKGSDDDLATNPYR